MEGLRLRDSIPAEGIERPGCLAHVIYVGLIKRFRELKGAISHRIGDIAIGFFSVF